MKVILKHGNVNYKGVAYTAGQDLDITEHFYNMHQSRFIKAVNKVSKKVVVTNDEPAKAKSEEKKSPAKPATKSAATKKPASKKAEL